MMTALVAEGSWSDDDLDSPQGGDRSRAQGEEAVSHEDCAGTRSLEVQGHPDRWRSSARDWRARAAPLSATSCWSPPSPCCSCCRSPSIVAPPVRVEVPIAAPRRTSIAPLEAIAETVAPATLPGATTAARSAGPRFAWPSRPRCCSASGSPGRRSFSCRVVVGLWQMRIAPAIRPAVAARTAIVDQRRSPPADPSSRRCAAARVHPRADDVRRPASGDRPARWTRRVAGGRSETRDRPRARARAARRLAESVPRACRVRLLLVPSDGVDRLAAACARSGARVRRRGAAASRKPTAYADQLVVLAQRLSTASSHRCWPWRTARSGDARQAVLDSRQPRGRAGAVWSPLRVSRLRLLVMTISPLRIVAATGDQDATARSEKFDVVSIKPCPDVASANTGRGAGPNLAQTSPGRVYWACVTLAALVDQAYAGWDFPLLNRQDEPLAFEVPEIPAGSGRRSATGQSVEGRTVRGCIPTDSRSRPRLP